MSLDNKDMFGIYLSGVAKALGLPSNPANLILTGNALPANLAYNSKALTNPPSLPVALSQIYTLGNTEAYPNGFYDATMNLFFNNYASYINNLVPRGSQQAATPTQQGQINLTKNNLANAQAQYNSDLSSAYAAYTTTTTMFPGQFPTFQSYLNQNTWGATLTTDQNLLNGYNSQLNNLYNQVYGSDYVAIGLANTTVNNVRSWMLGSTTPSPAVMSTSNGSGTLIVPTYTSGDLSQFSTWVDSTIQQHGNTGQTPINIGFTNSSNNYDFSKSNYWSHTSFESNFWFWSAGGSSTTSSSNVNINTDSSNFGLNLGFDAITQVSIQPGPWYDSSLMYDFPNTNGLVLPTSLLIAMYPSITLTMDAASYNSAQAAYNSSNGFGVGGFWCSAASSASASGVTMHANWNSASNSVTMKSESTTPVIIGMLVTKPGS